MDGPLTTCLPPTFDHHGHNFKSKQSSNQTISHITKTLTFAAQIYGYIPYKLRIDQRALIYSLSYKSYPGILFFVNLALALFYLIVPNLFNLSVIFHSARYPKSETTGNTHTASEDFVKTEITISRCCV
ncbi:hypothetical protein Fcan01_00406 [Folsomia candida]|uniref:Uncharacterized protein n=1 Tax=Folsomia candida TaxID=158441 RepID=A0A226F1H9_FOLCA|nr:hypothetical protein Fcan01_00406 [Folsomia candida]